MCVLFKVVVRDLLKDHAVAASTSITVMNSATALHRDDGFGSGAGVTRNYTDAREGCLLVDLSIDAGVAAGRAGHDLIGA